MGLPVLAWDPATLDGSAPRAHGVRSNRWSALTALGVVIRCRRLGGGPDRCGGRPHPAPDEPRHRSPSSSVASWSSSWWVWSWSPWSRVGGACSTPWVRWHSRGGCLRRPRRSSGGTPTTVSCSMSHWVCFSSRRRRRVLGGARAGRPSTGTRSSSPRSWHDGPAGDLTGRPAPPPRRAPEGWLLRAHPAYAKAIATFWAALAMTSDPVRTRTALRRTPGHDLPGLFDPGCARVGPRQPARGDLVGCPEHASCSGFLAVPLGRGPGGRPKRAPTGRGRPDRGRVSAGSSADLTRSDHPPSGGRPRPDPHGHRPRAGRGRCDDDARPRRPRRRRRRPGSGARPAGGRAGGRDGPRPGIGAPAPHTPRGWSTG